MSGMSEGASGPETHTEGDSNTKEGTVDLLDLGDDTGVRTYGSSSGASSSSSTAYKNVENTTTVNISSSKPINRGRKHVLPDDFLRPPGWSKNQFTLGDEQLALMLQNELFRKEVQAAMGQDVFARERSRRSSSSQGRTVTAAYTDGTNSGSQTGASTGDLGIMKALSEMGTGMCFWH